MNPYHPTTATNDGNAPRYILLRLACGIACGGLGACLTGPGLTAGIVALALRAPAGGRSATYEPELSLLGFPVDPNTAYFTAATAGPVLGIAAGILVAPFVALATKRWKETRG